MKRFSLAVFSVAMLLLLNGFSGASAACPSVNESAVVVRTFTVKDFSALQLSGNVQVVFTQGPLSVKAKASQSQLKYLQLKQENGRLSIGTKYPSGFVRRRNPILLYVSAPRLADLSLSGATRFDCNNLHADDFTLHISGASSAEVKAFEAQSVKVKASGASNLTLKGHAQTAALTSSGASTARLSLAGEGLNVVVSGASNVESKFVGNNLGAKVSGASRLSFNVNCREIDVKASGSSFVEAKGVASKRTLHKSGTAVIDVSELKK